MDRHVNFEQFINVIDVLRDFGYYETDGKTQMIPYWRGEQIVRLGDATPAKVQVGAYRRPLPDGKGYQSLIIVMNESRFPVTAPLVIADGKSLLGGTNTMTAAQAIAPSLDSLPDNAKAVINNALGSEADKLAVRDVETGEAILTTDNGTSYGPIEVPAHEFRIFRVHSAK